MATARLSRTADGGEPRLKAGQGTMGLGQAPAIGPVDGIEVGAGANGGYSGELGALLLEAQSNPAGQGWISCGLDMCSMLGLPCCVLTRYLGT